MFLNAIISTMKPDSKIMLSNIFYMAIDNQAAINNIPPVGVNLLYVLSAVNPL